MARTHPLVSGYRARVVDMDMNNKDLIAELRSLVLKMRTGSLALIDESVLTRAADALEAADGGWQPIEMLCKDGRPRLIGGYSKEEQVWRSAVCLWATGGEFWWDWPWGIKPTHWCDTPPPPTEGADQ